MTLSELKDRIKALPAKKQEGLNNLKVVISYSYINVEQTLTGFVDIYRFLKNQHTDWAKEEVVPEYLETSKAFFKHILENLEKYIENNFEEDRYHKDKKYITNSIKLLKFDKYKSRYVFTSKIPETEFLKSLHNTYPKSVSAAAIFLAGDGIEISTDYSNEGLLTSYDFIGMQQAYEFRLQDNERVRRSELEKKSLEALRDEFNKYIIEAQDTLNKHVQENTKMLQEKTEHIESLINEKEKLYTDWHSKNDLNYTDWLTQTKQSFQTFDEESKQNIKEKEELYTEKLKLEAPATYWRERALKLRKEGNRWMYFLIAVTVIAVVMLGFVLHFISDGTLKELFAANGSAIRWSVVFITFVSFLAFAIRTFAKLMFSAYHLVRDAEEREQLAYVYLALKKEQGIDDTERHLVMQSIFSRADSGLLKADAAPTMPGNILDKLSK
ncbi:hypothetical protein IMCC3317_06830 [Kordia antarctica]|uniref:DUF6161 domain-containing protein n=1 Tax=Kordia antarctica TaxID=1218801 RepID=A0A7L4ZFT1_9FLAO|nr:DUF6161 domain-containing protein [Kordia antarctica]QHI35337.1 hypothetical protein IMCC3317_06830 [Kordia antarctica]